MRSLQIRHIVVRDGALDVKLAVALDALRVDERTAQRVLGVLPNLARHVCVNGSGERFGDEIVGTELPHLFEHVVIELQGQASGARAPLTGHTSWLAPLSETRARGVALMRVTVTFNDDFTALRACEMARHVVEWALGYSEKPVDVAACVGELKGMMERL